MVNANSLRTLGYKNLQHGVNVENQTIHTIEQLRLWSGNLTRNDRSAGLCSKGSLVSLLLYLKAPLSATRTQPI